MAKRKPNSGKLAPKIFQRDIAEDFNTQLLPVIQNLTALGYQDTEIGTVVGFAGQLTKDWLKSLMKERQDVAEAIKTGRLLAKAALIAKLVQVSLGYDYEEVDETWVPTITEKSNGQKKWELARKVIHRRHQSASVPAMLQLAERLMPDVFRDKDKEPGDITEDQIRKLVGKLGEISRDGPTILGADTKRTAGEHRIPITIEQTFGERQELPTDNAPMDSGMAPNSV